MIYRYETHLHTKEASACAGATGAEQAQWYYENGYAGIIVTDHFFNGNSCVRRDLPWKEKAALFCKGYESAKKRGDELGLDVFFGWEAGYYGTEFLIYGLDPEWLINHADIDRWSIEEQYVCVKEAGGMVIQAHPFREAPYIPRIRLYPDCCDGVEGFNLGNERVGGAIYNKEAYEYAARYNLPATRGSDSHHAGQGGASTDFDHRLESIQDYIECVMNKSYLKTYEE